jgi:hypothetical protein
VYAIICFRDSSSSGNSFDSWGSAQVARSMLLSMLRCGSVSESELALIHHFALGGQCGAVWLKRCNRNRSRLSLTRVQFCHHSPRPAIFTVSLYFTMATDVAVDTTIVRRSLTVILKIANSRRVRLSSSSTTTTRPRRARTSPPSPSAITSMA